MGRFDRLTLHVLTAVLTGIAVLPVVNWIQQENETEFIAPVSWVTPWLPLSTLGMWVVGLFAVAGFLTSLVLVVSATVTRRCPRRPAMAEWVLFAVVTTLSLSAARATGEVSWVDVLGVLAAALLVAVKLHQHHTEAEAVCT